MVHLQLFRSNQPVLIIKSYSVNTEEIEERYSEYPTVMKEIANRDHC